jgi:hypothetical protein
MNIWDPNATSEQRLRAIKLPLHPSARGVGIASSSAFGQRVGRDPATGLAANINRFPGTGGVCVGHTSDALWVDPGPAPSSLTTPVTLPTVDRIPLHPSRHGSLTDNVIGKLVGRSTNGNALFSIGPQSKHYVGVCVGYGHDYVDVEPGPAISAYKRPTLNITSVSWTGSEPNTQNLKRPRSPAKRDACGFLLCDECAQPSPYAEPATDGSFTCTGCRMFREASQ